MLDRVERNDVLNAVALAVALLVFGFGLIRAFGFLSESVDDGLWEAEGREEEPVVDPIAPGLGLRPANEVTIRVGNGSDGRQGLAGRATRRLEGLGYGTLDPQNKEGEPIDDGAVYYIDGYKADAVEVASQLGIEETRVRPLLDNPGVVTDGADVIVVLGQNSDF